MLYILIFTPNLLGALAGAGFRIIKLQSQRLNRPVRCGTLTALRQGQKIASFIARTAKKEWRKPK